MKTASKILALIFLCLIGCQKKSEAPNILPNKAQSKDSISEEIKRHDDILNSHVSVVNYNADSIFYKLDFIDSYEQFFGDSLILLVTKKAFKLKEVSTISIKKEDGLYENVWRWENDFTDHGSSIGKFDFQFTLGSVVDNFGNGLNSRLYFNFRLPQGNSWHLFVLTFKNENKVWKLVSRETFTTDVFYSRYEKPSYCIDTTFTDLRKNKENEIMITNSFIFIDSESNKRCF